MKRKVILNEKKFIEDNIINVDTLNIDEIHPDTAIRYLTRYYCEKGMSLDECYNIIFKIMEGFNLNVNLYQEYLAKNSIKRCYNATKDGRIPTLKEYESIPLYKSEYDKIMECSNKKERKLMFTLYILARYTNRYGWIYENEAYIFKAANISCAVKDRADIIHVLLKRNMIKDTKRIDDNKIGVELSNCDEEIVFSVSSLEHLGNQFIVFITSGCKMCAGENCGKVIKIRNNKTKFCTSCAEKSKRIKKMDWWKRQQIQ